MAQAADRLHQPVSIEAFATANSLHAPRLSPDGRYVAVALQTPDPNYVYDGSLAIRAGKPAVRVIDTATGKMMHIAPENEESYNPAWSPNSRQLAYLVGKGDRTRAWVWSVTDRRGRQVSDAVPRYFEASLRWTPDSRRLVVAVLPAGLSYQELRERTGEAGDEFNYPIETPPSGAGVAVYRGGSLAHSARRDFTNNDVYRADLAVIDVQRRVWRRIATGYRPVRYRISPDGRSVVFTHVAGQESGSGYYSLNRIFVLPVEGGSPRPLGQDIRKWGFMDVSWSPDSRWLTFYGDDANCYLAEVERSKLLLVPNCGNGPGGNALHPPLWDVNSDTFYVLEEGALAQARVTGLTVRHLTLPPGKTILQLVQHQDSQTVAKTRQGGLLMHTRDVNSYDEGFYALDPSQGTAAKLYEDAVSLQRQIEVSSTGVIAYIQERADACEQLWVSDLQFRQSRQISTLNPHLQAFRMGKSRLLKWRGLEGDEMRGALLLPSNYQLGKRFPLIVDVYGDELLSKQLNSFGLTGKVLSSYDNKQLLSTRGYAVLKPDTRTRVGTPMFDIAAGVMSAVDAAIASGIADSERLGLMGHSYGGYSVLATIVQTRRFKAAIVSAGLANLIGGFSQMSPNGTSWQIALAEQGQGKMGGSLWDFRERYIENSPLFYFDRISTPVLVIHGSADRAPMVHAGDEIFQALRHLDKEVEYVKYLGQGHIVTGRANSIDYAERIIAWFDTHLKGTIPAGENALARGSR